MELPIRFCLNQFTVSVKTLKMYPMVPHLYNEFSSEVVGTSTRGLLRLPLRPELIIY